MTYLPGLLTALLALAPAPAAPAEKAPTATPKAEAPPIFDPEADGELALDARFEVSQQSNRRQIVFFGTNDCQACRVVNAAVHEKCFYEELIKQFVPEFIDVAPGTSNAEIPRRYGIDPKAPLPGAVIFEPGRRVAEVPRKARWPESRGREKRPSSSGSSSASARSKPT